jgi:hypothetical protein
MNKQKFDNKTIEEILKDSGTYTLDTKTKGNRTLYLNVYKDRLYIVLENEFIKTATEDREEAFECFERLRQ